MTLYIEKDYEAYLKLGLKEHSQNLCIFTMIDLSENFYFTHTLFQDN